MQTISYIVQLPKVALGVVVARAERDQERLCLGLYSVLRGDFTASWSTSPATEKSKSPKSCVDSRCLGSKAVSIFRGNSLCLFSKCSLTLAQWGAACKMVRK